jgi:hypothetical protein
MKIWVHHKQNGTLIADGKAQAKVGYKRLKKSEKKYTEFYSLIINT